MAEVLFQVVSALQSALYQHQQNFETLKKKIVEQFETTLEEIRANVQQFQPALESARKMQQAIIQSTIDSIEANLKVL